MAGFVRYSLPRRAFWRGPELAVAAVLTALCLALPTHNPTGDAWYYAACSRWGHELWQPHHLIYNGVGWLWLRLLGATGPGPAGNAALPWLQALNSLAYGGCLLLLGPLLRRAGVRPAAVPAWLLAVGSTFGMLRFAVENEAYIQPLLAALGASLAWAQALGSTSFTGDATRSETPTVSAMVIDKAAGNQPDLRLRWLLLAGLLAALACLLHQMLVWWWLGLLLGLHPWRGRRALGAALAYAAPALLVPWAYWLAAPPGGGALGAGRFALHDYLTGAARVGLGSRGWLLTPINLVRTLGQVHGNLWPLLRRWPLLLGVVAAGCLALAVWAIMGSRPKLDSKQEASNRQLLKPVLSASQAVFAPGPAAARRLRRTHGLIGALQVGFVVLSAGNAEFMVLLPALAALGLAGGGLRAWPARRVAALGAALLLWNVAVGLVPARLLTFTAAGPALRTAAQQQPAAWFILLDPNPLRNQLHYYTGQPVAPARVLGLAGQDSASFRAWLRRQLAGGAVVYTDALGGPQPLDRARLTLGNPATLLGGFGARRVMVLPTFLGPYYLSKLALPAAAGPRRSHPSAKASAPATTGAAR
ncbi:hypothetical protein HHL22_15665 [Hymenobacter sp. RP-2-7]|uniref:DUF2723 domain-containing protein n=1 Tax=Hymenobacter polaris TaxID=2682546 RepID=A0A7Y0FNQ6_9BACT|nr:hypothetical protein [Hymenobacter polaris]NML66644.1 hypothetical protein [Hymenobacter polaris]